MVTRAQADYQKFQINPDGTFSSVNDRLLAKQRAIKLPDLNGRTVLDVGCDFGFWSFLAANLGARKVLGLDRNREVNGVGQVDLIDLNNKTASDYPAFMDCEFKHTEVGKQWRLFGEFDVVFLFSLYHHIYECAGGDHKPVWYWLWLHTRGYLVWENPMSPLDQVVQRNVSQKYHENYNPTAIMDAALEYFEPEYIGPALHEKHREVFWFRPRSRPYNCHTAKHVAGASGASKAFAFEDNRRVKEIENILGYAPIPGSFNLEIDTSINWWGRYFRAEVLDLLDRSKGLNSQWALRWARFYPVEINEIPCHVFRFEGESYPLNFIEVISDKRLKDQVGEFIRICQ